MHNYSIMNSKIRITVTSTIAIISAYVAFMLNPYLEGIGTNIPISTYLLPLYPFAVFGIFYYLFDTVLWKLKPINKLLEIPDVSGTWKGEGQTTYNNSKSTKFNIELNIKQTFSRIIIDGKFNQSYSESINANIDCSNPLRRKLVYSYTNKPQAITTKTMQNHVGTVELCLNEKSTELKGNYFTNRKPLTSGTLKLSMK